LPFKIVENIIMGMNEPLEVWLKVAVLGVAPGVLEILPPLSDGFPFMAIGFSVSLQAISELNGVFEVEASHG
jgi:hypothetical protein